MFATREGLLVQAFTRRSLVILLLALVSTGAMPVKQPARAQDAPFDCAAPNSANASPTIADTQVAATPPAGTSFPESGGELTVFAAASLTDAFETMKSELEAAHPGLHITYNFAGSQALVTQLNEGAEADVFASANNAQMEAAAENGSIAGDSVTFVQNELVIVTPAENPAGIETPTEIGNDGVRLVLAQAEVPAGRYAREAVCKMAQDTAEFGENFVERVAANVVSEEEDVRDVLAKVELGEADAGIVYRSDAFIGGDQVYLIEIPEEVNVLASYPIAAVTGGDQALAEAFIAYLLSAEGQTTLEQFGFAPRQ